MTRWDERQSKRFARWILAVVAPLMVILLLFSPERWFWWEYLALVLWSILGGHAAYRLITERKARA
jgi:hypothetical protein